MTRDLKIVSAAMITWGFGEGMFHIFQPLYIQQFGADPILIGTILGFYGLVMAVAQIPSGYLADKIGRRPLMRFSWISGVVAAWVMALAPSLGFYIGGLLLYGLTSSVMAPLNTYVQGARGKWSVGRAVSFISAFYNIGGILGPIVGGVMGEIYNLRMVYFGSAIMFTISTTIIFFAQKQPVEDLTLVDDNSHLLRNQQFLKMLLVIFVVMFAVTLPQPLAANYLQNQRNLTFSQIGQLGSLGALGSVLLMLLLGHLRAGAAMILGQVGLMIFALLLWKGQTIVWYGVAFFFSGGYRLSRAMSVALVRPVVREHEVGLAFGLVESLNAMAFVIAPVAAGVIYEWRPVMIFPVSLAVLSLALASSLPFLFRNGRLEKTSGDESAATMEVSDES